MIARNIIVTDATALPVTDAEILAQFREDQTVLNSLYPYVRAAVDEVRGDTLCAELMQTTYELQMDDFYTDDFLNPVVRSNYPNDNGKVTLPKFPIVSITSVKYYDTSNVLQTLASTNYDLDSASYPGKMRYNGSATLPSVYDKPNAVIIRYVAGWGASGADVDTQRAAIPAGLKMAVLMRAVDLYENRLVEYIGPNVSKSASYWNLVSKYKYAL